LQIGSSGKDNQLSGKDNQLFLLIKRFHRGGLDFDIIGFFILILNPD